MNSEVEAFVSGQRVARLATVDEHGRPHVVPICFVMVEGAVYSVLDSKPKRVKVTRLRRVRNLLANPHVQVLLDRYDEDWSQLSYVQLRGRASVIEAGSEQSAAVRLLREKYTQYGEMAIDASPVIRVEVDEVVTWSGESR